MMRRLFPFVPLMAVVGCGVGGGSSVAPVAPPALAEGALPRAVCGAGSVPEPGVQGRTRAVEDISSGVAAQGYSCNLELVGHEGTKALWQMAWFDDCAYYGISVGDGGVAVVDVSNPEAPVRTTTLMTGAMLDPWESLKVNEKRGLLAAVGPSVAGPASFDVYDVNDVSGHACSAPAVQSVLPANIVGHEGAWAPDGLTYWATGLEVVTPIDVTNPSAPHILYSEKLGAHGLSLSEDGNRAYIANQVDPDTPVGLTIQDTSAIQSRAAVPAIRTVSYLPWEDGGTSQFAIPVKIKGKPYVIVVDEAAGGGQAGMTRIVDISDETRPFVISKLRDEINLPENMAMRVADGGDSGFTYQGHYCGVPQNEEPEILACSWFWQGIRVFDIRDPYHPTEIAYIVPGTDDGSAPYGNTSSSIRFIKERGEIWFTDQNHGFYVARFTNGVWPFH